MSTRWFAERQHPTDAGSIVLTWHASKEEAEAQCAAWKAEGAENVQYWEYPYSGASREADLSLVERLEQWLRDGYTDNETPLDLYGREIVKEVLTVVQCAAVRQRSGE